MKIYIGADHQGFYLRNSLLRYLKSAGYDVIDTGDKKLDVDDDFPVFAGKVVNGVLTSGENEARGILICGSGQGMCMAANRFKGIRAAMGFNQATVRDSRNDDDANVICLPAKILEKDKANLLVETFLNTEFAGAARFKRRIKELDELS